MKRLFMALLALLPLLASIPVVAVAQETARSERVRFPAGGASVTIRDRITGFESVSYLLDLRAGQSLRVRMTASNPATYFNVYEPGRGPGDEALASSDLTGPNVPEPNVFEGRVARSGVHTVTVYLFRSAARRGERSNIELVIGADGGPRPPASGGGDIGDGNAGGPDFWRVTGIASGDLLNIRSGPTTLAEVVRRVPEGSLLRNLGCRVVAQQRWCNVETTAAPRVTGWASARYLREAAGPSTGRPPVVQPPQRPEETVNRLPCARGRGQLTTSCRITVDRTGRRQGAVVFFWPDGGNRVIYFDGGEPTDFERTRTDANPRLRVQEEAGLYFVRVGDERFEMPASLLGNR